MEAGDYLPGRDNLFMLLHWLGYAATSSAKEPHPPGAPTVEAIELHLHADKRLLPSDAHLIAQVVRLLYEHLRETRRQHPAPPELER